ncbi:hypothetical protein HDU83_007753 [Entophlyctis luteolus]|nr:hypothetical protein HDU82_001757 [Entophlyctis luteolus]KAJ3352683.1 hypothetical protein HDU83_007753 [Entophlyctis luteolus]
MGIPGLSSLVRDTTGGATPLKLAASSGAGLIIDGNALVHSVAVVPDPSVPAVVLRIVSLAESLASVCAPLFIVFDGPLPKWKHSQRFDREKDKLAKVRRGAGPGDVLSPLALLASIQSLAAASAAGAGFQVVVANGEADLEITALARLHNAYIAGGDSDFLVHRSRGYIPLETLAFTPAAPATATTPATTATVSGKVWTYERVAAGVGLPVTFMPLLAAIAGCDYCLHDRWRKVRVIGSIGKGGNDRIKSLITYLRGFKTLPTAIDSVIAKTGGKNLPDTASFTAEIYAIIDIFTTGGSTTSPELSKYIQDTYPPLSSTPKLSFDQDFKAGVKSHKLFEAANGDFWCQAIIEDLAKRPVWEASRSIRKHLYSILGLELVAEHGRRALEFVIEKVESVPLPAPSTPGDLSATNSYVAALGCQDLDLAAFPRVYVPIVCAVKYVIALHQATPTQQPRDFEIEALLCAAISRMSSPRPVEEGESESSETPAADAAPAEAAVAPAAAVKPAPIPRPSKPMVHLLASLETVLLSALLLWQALDTTEKDAAFEQAHWQCLDGGKFATFMLAGRAGNGGPEAFLEGRDDLVAVFEALWKAVYGVEREKKVVVDEVAPAVETVEGPKDENEQDSKGSTAEDVTPPAQEVAEEEEVMIVVKKKTRGNVLPDPPKKGKSAAGWKQNLFDLLGDDDGNADDDDDEDED